MPFDQKTQRISVRLPVELAFWLENEARKQRVTVSDVVRHALLNMPASDTLSDTLSDNQNLTIPRGLAECRDRVRQFSSSVLLPTYHNIDPGRSGSLSDTELVDPDPDAFTNQTFDELIAIWDLATEPVRRELAKTVVTAPLKRAVRKAWYRLPNLDTWRTAITTLVAYYQTHGHRVRQLTVHSLERLASQIKGGEDVLFVERLATDFYRDWLTPEAKRVHQRPIRREIATEQQPLAHPPIDTTKPAFDAQAVKEYARQRAEGLNVQPPPGIPAMSVDTARRLWGVNQTKAS